jgi:hypothetical protein
VILAAKRVEGSAFDHCCLRGLSRSLAGIDIDTPIISK